MDLGVLFFGVGIGMILSTVLVGLGVEIADKRYISRVLSNNNSGNNNIYKRRRHRRGNNRRNKPR